MDARALEAELRRLYRGRGVDTPDLDARVGPLLARCLPASGTGTHPNLRAALSSWLADRIEVLPADLRVVATVAFGLHPPAGGRFLGDRVRWLAANLGRDERTVRRRLGEAVRLLAEAGAAGALIPPAMPPFGGDGPPAPNRPAMATGNAEAAGNASQAEGWYLERLSSLLRLDLPSPEVFEERRIVATVSGLEAVTLSVSLPRVAGEPVAGRDLLADAAYGGILVRRERPSDSYFQFVVALPRPLAHGEAHELALRVRLPAGQRMAAHYGFTPMVRCDEFRLRVRFPAAVPPSGIWLLGGVPPRTVDDEPAGLSPVVLDRAGEAQVRFTRLGLGRSYGLRWRE